MPEITFICTANQFRSPIAAAYFKKKLETNGITDVIVSSAGTWTEAGFPAHTKALIEATKLGLDLRDHKTREINKEIVDHVDLLVVMEQGQKEAIECEFPDAKGKIILLGSIKGENENEIPDPAKENFKNSAEVVQEIIFCIESGFSRLIDLVLSGNNNCNKCAFLISK